MMRATGSLVENDTSQTYRANHNNGNENNDNSTPTFDNGGHPKMSLSVGGFSGLDSSDNGVIKIEGSGNWLALDAEL